MFIGTRFETVPTSRAALMPLVKKVKKRACRRYNITFLTELKINLSGGERRPRQFIAEEAQKTNPGR